MRPSTWLWLLAAANLATLVGVAWVHAIVGLDDRWEGVGAIHGWLALVLGLVGCIAAAEEER